MDGATLARQGLDAGRDKPVWPAVIGVLSCVLAAQALAYAVVNGVGALGVQDLPYVSSCVIGEESRCWNYVVFWTDKLAWGILLAAGIVLLREWHGSGLERRLGALLHRVYACTWIVVFLARAIPVYRFYWAFCLRGTGMDGKPNSVETRLHFTWLVLAMVLTDLMSLAYPVFLLVWFAKKRRCHGA
jgi:hypothetical protein